MGEKLPFIVGGAASIENVVFERWSEWCSAPFIQRFSGYHIVVAVDDHCRPAQSASPRGIDDGMTAGRNDANLIEAYAVQMPRQPGRAPSDIRRTLWL